MELNVTTEEQNALGNENILGLTRDWVALSRQAVDTLDLVEVYASESPALLRSAPAPLLDALGVRLIAVLTALEAECARRDEAGIVAGDSGIGPALAKRSDAIRQVTRERIAALLRGEDPDDEVEPTTAGGTGQYL